MRQLFTWTLSSVSDFAQNFAFMKSRLVLFSTVTMAHLTVFVFLKRFQFEVFYFIASDTDLKELTTSRVFNWEFYNLSCFERNNFTTRQVLQLKNYIASDIKPKNSQQGGLWIKNSYNVLHFDLKNLQRVRFWYKLFYNLSDSEEMFL